MKQWNSKPKGQFNCERIAIKTEGRCETEKSPRRHTTLNGKHEI